MHPGVERVREFKPAPFFDFIQQMTRAVEYKGNFCSGCSIPPPGAVRGWLRGYRYGGAKSNSVVGDDHVLKEGVLCLFEHHSAWKS